MCHTAVLFPPAGREVISRPISMPERYELGCKCQHFYETFHGGGPTCYPS